MDYSNLVCKNSRFITGDVIENATEIPGIPGTGFSNPESRERKFGGNSKGLNKTCCSSINATEHYPPEEVSDPKMDESYLQAYFHTLRKSKQRLAPIRLVGAWWFSGLFEKTAECTGRR